MILRNHFRSSHERKGKGKNWDRLKFSLEHDGKKKGEKKKRKGSLERFLLDIDSFSSISLRSLTTVFVRTRSWESLGKARALGRREGLSNRPVASFTVKSPLSSLCARHGDRETRARNTTEDNPAAILCRLLLGPLERFSGRVERTNSKRTNWWADLEIRLENPNVLG